MKSNTTAGRRKRRRPSNSSNVHSPHSSVNLPNCLLNTGTAPTKQNVNRNKRKRINSVSTAATSTTVSGEESVNYMAQYWKDMIELERQRLDIDRQYMMMESERAENERSWMMMDAERAESM